MRVLTGCVDERASVISCMRASSARAIAGIALEKRLREDHVDRNRAVAIRKTHRRIVEHVHRARIVEGPHFDKHILHFAAIGPAIHAQGPADGAGNAAQEGEPVDPRFRRDARDLHIRRARTGAHAMAVFDRNLRKTPPEPDQHAGQAAIADEQVGAAPDHRQRQIRRPVREKQRQIRFVGGLEQELRRPAGAKPGQGRCRRIRRERAAQIRYRGADVLPAIGKAAHLRSPDGSVPRAASWPGRA